MSNSERELQKLDNVRKEDKNKRLTVNCSKIECMVDSKRDSVETVTYILWTLKLGRYTDLTIWIE